MRLVGRTLVATVWIKAEPGSRHTITETWLPTSTRTRSVRQGVDGHELSKPRVIVLSWSAERIGPRIMAAPQDGHVHLALVGGTVVSGVVSIGVAAGEVGVDSAARARTSRALRQVLARKPDWRMRTKPRGKMC